jgi:curved DNA-binding protein CbpA
LGLHIDATPTEIRSAYRQLVKLHHPDMHQGHQDSQQFLLIQEAYEVLSDPDRNAFHRQQLLRQQTSYSAHQQAQRQQIYEQWVRHQHREALKRKVAEMRRREQEEENERNVIWYSFAAIKFLLYFLAAISLLIMTFVPIGLYFSNNELKHESGVKLLMASIMGATFLSFFSKKAVVHL